VSDVIRDLVLDYVNESRAGSIRTKSQGLMSVSTREEVLDDPAAVINLPPTSEMRDLCPEWAEAIDGEICSICDHPKDEHARYYGMIRADPFGENDA
jgi:hypothetical protein